MIGIFQESSLASRNKKYADVCAYLRGWGYYEDLFSSDSQILEESMLD